MRKNRTLAQIAQRGVHPAGNTTVVGRCTTSYGGLCRALQQCSFEQRPWLHHAEGHFGGTATGDPCGKGPEVGVSPKATAASSQASRLTNRALLGAGCGGPTSGYADDPRGGKCAGSKDRC